MKEITEIWESVLKQMAEEISAVSFDTWIKPINPVEITGNEITLSVKSALNKNMVMTKFRSMIESCLEYASGRSFELNVIIEDDNPEIKESASEPESSSIQRSALNPRYSFENFVVGENNNLAYGAALAVADSPGQKYNPLFLYGGSGLGKTHLLQAIGNRFSELYPGKRVLYTTSEKFTYELINAIREKTNQDFRNKYRTDDL